MANLTRAEVLTGSTRKTEFFSDFVDSFGKSPVGNQLGRVINEKSVNQSLKNIIMTNVGERLFQPYIGSDVYKSLFELNYQEFSSIMELGIQTAIYNSEPRVNLLGIDIQNGETEHELYITITYNLINNPDPINFTVVLKRVR